MIQLATGIFHNWSELSVQIEAKMDIAFPTTAAKQPQVNLFCIER
jgi:hypothetical protein